MTPTADEIAAEIKAGLEGVTPGEWEVESTKSDGSYGAGDDLHEGFDAFQVIAPPLYPGGRDVVVCDTLNSGCAAIAEEWDEDGSHNAWDEQGRKDMAHIARCSAKRMAILIDAYEAQRAEIAARDALIAEAREVAVDALEAIRKMQLGISIDNDRGNRGRIEGPVVTQLNQAADKLDAFLSPPAPTKENADGTR